MLHNCRDAKVQEAAGCFSELGSLPCSQFADVRAGFELLCSIHHGCTGMSAASRSAHLLQPLEKRRHRPCTPVNRAAKARGQYARYVLGEAAACDVHQALQAPGIPQGLHRMCS